MTDGIPGDIRAVAKIDDIHPDAILHDSHDEDFLHLQPSRFPLPVAGLAIRTRRIQGRTASCRRAAQTVGGGPQPGP